MKREHEWRAGGRRQEQREACDDVWDGVHDCDHGEDA